MHTQTDAAQRHSLVRRSPIFYGWVVWLAAAVGIAATSPGQSFSVSLFIDHYIADFALDRTSISALYGIGTFTASLILTWVGRQIDRHGNRRMSVLITLLFGLALLASARVSGPLTILLSFVAIRSLGQGSLGLVSTTAVAQWFRRKRGWVMGLALVIFAVFQRFYLIRMQEFIANQGWRAAWLLAGAVLLLGVLPLLAVFLRDRPEDFGLQPDGDAAPAAAEAAPIVEENWQLREVLTTPLFWAFNAARMLAAAWGTALIFHQISLFAQLGHSPAVAAATYGRAALMTAGITLGAGWLIDRLRPGTVVAIQMLGLGAATGLMMVMTETWQLFAYTVAVGVFLGFGSVFDGTVWVNLFGRRHQGAIRGFVATTGVMGTSVGPFVFGFSLDYLGSYHPAIWLGIILAGAALLAALWVKKPVKPAPALGS